jgi:hypothetical protein
LYISIGIRKPFEYGMAKQQGLRGRLQAPSPAPSKSSNTAKATKRKRRVTAILESTPLDLGLISSAEEISDVEERPRKKAGGEKKSAKKMADPKKQGAKAARQTYTSILGKVDKKVGELDRKCKAQGPNGKKFNSDDYAKAVAEFLPEVIDLSNMDGGVKFAFNLVLYLGEHAHGDFYMCIKMCGYGGSKKPYNALDEVMLGLIERRKDEATEDDVQAVEATSLPLVPHRWTEADADVGEFKTGRPNKQQRNQIVRQRQEWMKERSKKARERRETTKDWVCNALVELIDEKNYLDGFGLDGYFVKSIARLEELKSTTSRP